MGGPQPLDPSLSRPPGSESRRPRRDRETSHSSERSNSFNLDSRKGLEVSTGIHPHPRSLGTGGVGTKVVVGTSGD